MKKKLALLIVLLVTIYIIPVHAATWPKTYTTGNFSYSIEGAELRVYEVSTDKVVWYSSNYLSETPDKTITLQSSDYTIDPQVKTDKLGKSDALFVNVKLNMTKAKLETLLATEKAAATSSKAYIVELVLKYKFTNYPSTYTHVYKVNTLRTRIDELLTPNAGTTSIEASNNGEITPTSVNTQVLNVITIEYDASSSTGAIAYDTTATDENGLVTFVANYEEFYKTEKSTSNNTPDYVVMFHNIENIDFLINSLKASETQLSVGGQDGAGVGDTVNVDDTAKSVPILLYFASLASLFVGSGLVIYTIEKDKQKQIG